MSELLSDAVSQFFETQLLTMTETVMKDFLAKQNLTVDSYISYSEHNKNYNLSLLAFAVNNNAMLIADVLIKMHATLNDTQMEMIKEEDEVTYATEYTLLEIAAKNGNKEMAEFLIEKGADPLEHGEKIFIAKNTLNIIPMPVTEKVTTFANINPECKKYLLTCAFKKELQDFINNHDDKEGSLIKNTAAFFNRHFSIANEELVKTASVLLEIIDDKQGSTALKEHIDTIQQGKLHHIIEKYQADFPEINLPRVSRDAHI